MADSKSKKLNNVFMTEPETDKICGAKNHAEEIKTTMRMFKLILIATIVAFGFVASAAQTKNAETSAFAKLQLKGFVAAPAATIDPATKLPSKIVHQASGIALILIPAGEFLMGSAETEAGRDTDESQHRRIIKRAFYIGETEVTTAQFRKFALASNYLTDAERGTEENGFYKGAFSATPDGNRKWTLTASWRNPFPNLKEYRPAANHPVVHVSWYDSRRFADYFGFQLPTEAQWEYAARAGSKTRFSWCETEAEAQGFGNFKDSSGRKRFADWNLFFPFDDKTVLLSPVAKYRPNNWGIYDTQGNISEWTEDVYGKYPNKEADESAALGEENAVRVLRGGSWLDSPDFSRSAKRMSFPPNARRDFVGFRVAVNVL